MAQKYGGKFSPDGGSKEAPIDRGTYLNARRTKAGGRVNILFLLPLILIVKAFSAEPIVMAQYLVAMGLLLLSAWLTRDGIIAQEAYEARKIARRPALPRKMLGSVLTGLGLGFVGIAGYGPVEAVIFAVLGTVLHSAAFGFDPLKNKGMEGVDLFQQDRVAKVVDNAEAYLRGMHDAVKRSGDRQAEARVDRFQQSVRDMLRTVEEDPRDLTAARKYLGVYLMGARDATVKFADIYARSQDRDARSKYMMLLTDLEENFVAKTQKLLQDNQSDLDIEIDVLRDRLQREGLTLE